MTRSDIRGFTIRIGGWWFEVVTVYHFPVTLAICKNHNKDHIWRIGR
jgi:hypothetical protein